MIMTMRQALPIGTSEALRKGIQGGEVFVMATRPDFLLP